MLAASTLAPGAAPAGVPGSVEVTGGRVAAGVAARAEAVVGAPGSTELPVADGCGETAGGVADSQPTAKTGMTRDTSTLRIRRSLW
jgi:hypothetical protein